MLQRHSDFWAWRDTLDWPSRIVARRRNCMYVCKYGNPGCSLLDIRAWPLSLVRQAADDINYWLLQEEKNAKAS